MSTNGKHPAHVAFPSRWFLRFGIVVLILMAPFTLRAETVVLPSVISSIENGGQCLDYSGDGPEIEDLVPGNLDAADSDEDGGGDDGPSSSCVANTFEIIFHPDNCLSLAISQKDVSPCDAFPLNKTRPPP
jgi:hypothetical protein